MWFAAHLVEVFLYREGEQPNFGVWENIVLIEAVDGEEAWEKAEQLGQDSQSDDSGLTVDGKPGRREFAGVRKIVECVDGEQRPVHGTEVSYNSLIFTSEMDVKRFVDGEEVGAIYQNETPASLDD